jgi:hypothetical protein
MMFRTFKHEPPAPNATRGETASAATHALWSPPVPEAHLRAAEQFRRLFKPTTYEAKDEDSLELRMLKKIYNAVVMAKDGAIDPKLKRTIQSAAFAGIDGPDPGDLF